MTGLGADSAAGCAHGRRSPANFKETPIAQICPGQTVDITIDAFPDVDFTGTVLAIQNAAGQALQLLPPQNATHNFV